MSALASPSPQRPPRQPLQDVALPRGAALHAQLSTAFRQEAAECAVPHALLSACVPPQSPMPQLATRFLQLFRKLQPSQETDALKYGWPCVA